MIKTTTSHQFAVYVDDNFHYLDESERALLGTFLTHEEAVQCCQKIVWDCIQDCDGRTAV